MTRTRARRDNVSGGCFISFNLWIGKRTLMEERLSRNGRKRREKSGSKDQNTFYLSSFLTRHFFRRITLITP
ncbi:hypothetical protein BJ165DRAFT_1493988 [Panaeolus papilionaceus]|nr:hypothetical protein BJ165DRAFT_1493988 [Panaeolus papilionaceus]